VLSEKGGLRMSLEVLEEKEEEMRAGLEEGDLKECEMKEIEEKDREIEGLLEAIGIVKTMIETSIETIERKQEEGIEGVKQEMTEDKEKDQETEKKQVIVTNGIYSMIEIERIKSL
jgi:hypothetical protein